jgi:lycopene beta-cyclase
MGQKIIILGGGLWGSMLAYFFHIQNPGRDLELYEKNDRLGGDHTWSFHSTDLPPDLFSLIEPFISCSWSSQTVKFPLFTRNFSTGYHSIISSNFHDTMMSKLPSEKVFLGMNKSLGDFSPDCIIFDCRNLPVDVDGGWQNFYGLDLILTHPHGMERPIIMDATVPQRGGYRFVYYLPWDSHRILIEDTRYSDSREMDLEKWKGELGDLIESNGWEIKKVERTEVGSLPIPFQELPSTESPPHVISLGGFSHEVTGYSIPDCMRLCHLLASHKEHHLEAWREVISRYQREKKWRSLFYRWLNRFLFLGSPPPMRYKMLQHFYKLPDSVIQRFYAGKTTLPDMLKFFLGKPPLPLTGVFKVLRDQRSISP